MSQKRQVFELSLKDFTHGDSQARKKFIDELFVGLKEYGFINLRDHGVDSDLLKKAYELSEQLFNLPEETKKQYDAYKIQYEELNESIHQLDTNSMYFRFPVDNKGKHHPLYMKGERLYKILKLYYLTDPFITFTLDVLEEEGIN